MNKIWGTVEQITLPDLTVLSNEYDENNIVQVKKCVTKDSLERSNEISYLNDFVSRLGTDNLKYSFNYSKNDLERVSRVSLNDSNEEVLNITEQHTYNIDSNKETTVVKNYPSSSPRLYYETIKYNKYGQLINDAGNITCTYDVDSYFIPDSPQYSFGSIGVNSKNGKLATLTDLKTEEVIKYGYNKNNLEYVFRYDEDGTNIKKTIYTYDKNKLTSIKYTYDIQNDNTFESKIYYIEASDQSLDGKIDKYEYLQNDTVELETKNIYDQYGRTSIKKYTLGNKEYRHTFTYDLTRLLAETNESGVISYQYDQLNRIIKKTKGNYVTNYQYDIYGQLIREDNGRLNKTYQYEYDNIGNIVSKKTYNYTTGILGNPSITKNFSYTNETYKDRLTSYSNKSITYNIVGAVTSYDGDTFTWTSGKLTKITNGNVSIGTNQYTYTYNGLGQRIKKTYTYLQGLGSITALQPGQLIGFVKKYEYDENGRLVIEEITSSYYQSSHTLEKLTYLYNDNMIIGFKYYANGTTNNYYYERNVFGDVIGIYDMSRNRVVEYAYDAWGNCTLYNVSNYTLANLNPIRYRGYYFDKESNLYFCDARYYSPELCRFISPDSIEYLDPESINGLNLYCYCMNNPIMYADPSGHFVITLSTVLAAAAIGAAIGVVSGAVYGGITAVANGQNVWAGIGIGALTGVFVGAGAGVASLFIAPVLAGEGVMVATATGAGFVMGNALSAGAALAIGTGIAFGTGFVGGIVSDASTQVINDGGVNDWGSVFVSGIQWGLINTAGAFFGSMGGTSTLNGALLSAIFGGVTGAVSMTIDILRNRKNQKQKVSVNNQLYAYCF